MSSLDRLIAKDAIKDCLIRYAVGIDRCDKALLDSVFWPDAACDYGTFQGRAEALVGYLVDSIPKSFVLTTHQLSNMLVTFDDAERAASQTYFNAYHEYVRGGAVTVAGRYVDTHLRRDGEWRVATRTFVLDWFAGNAEREDFPVSWSRRHRGGHKPNDPWYTRA